jgi:hypothetical protein
MRRGHAPNIKGVRPFWNVNGGDAALANRANGCRAADEFDAVLSEKEAKLSGMTPTRCERNPPDS